MSMASYATKNDVDKVVEKLKEELEARLLTLRDDLIGQMQETERRMIVCVKLTEKRILEELRNGKGEEAGTREDW